MSKPDTCEVIVIGDATVNTLGVIRSMGKAKINFALILVGEDSIRRITQSKYISNHNMYKVNAYNEVYPLLERLSSTHSGARLVCTCDLAAECVDEKESSLHKRYRTPMNGGSMKQLLNKYTQCNFVQNYGVTVPVFYQYSTEISSVPDMRFPVLIKPQNSNKGTKGDIHICRSKEEFIRYTEASATCTDFIVQEFIEKDYEINFLGVSNDKGVFVCGGIKKIRHYPDVNSACSFGCFYPISFFEKQGFNHRQIEDIIRDIGYHGVFSAEFLKRNDKYYFMEVNFRNDGLAYAATCAGANLVRLYVRNEAPDFAHLCSIYMMDTAADYNHVKECNLSFFSWVCDVIKSRCHLYLNFNDIGPALGYYVAKIRRLIHLL